MHGKKASAKNERETVNSQHKPNGFFQYKSSREREKETELKILLFAHVDFDIVVFVCSVLCMHGKMNERTQRERPIHKWK